MPEPHLQELSSDPALPRSEDALQTRSPEAAWLTNAGVKGAANALHNSVSERPVKSITCVTSSPGPSYYALKGITGTGKFVTVLFPTLVHAAHDVVYKQVLRV